MDTEASSITDGNRENRRGFGWKGGVEGRGGHWEPGVGGGETWHTLFIYFVLGTVLGTVSFGYHSGSGSEAVFPPFCRWKN